MTRYHKYAPVLRYLVEKDGMYVWPDGRQGYVAGQTAWADPALQFPLAADASAHARRVGGRIVKLRVYAVREPVRRDNRAVLDHVPRAGDVAFSQGWDTKTNPHPSDTSDAMRWISDWWRANADAFESHVYGEEA